MKKIVAIWLLALLPLFGIAQPLDARQRTAETIVADALAQLPVSTPALFDEVMGEIAATGSRGVEMVASMFVPAAEGKNTTLEYALNGVVCYASAPGREALLPEIRKGLVAALAQEGDTAKRSFLISQLQLCGTAEEAAALLPALDDPALADYALRALVSMPGTEELLLSLARQEGLTTARRCALARAFADKGTAAAEPVLTAWAAGADEELKAALWPALARCGTASSLRLLGEAAAAVGYAAEPTEATESYLVLLERCAAAGDAKPVAKAARKLLACDRQYVRGAALRLLVLTQGVRKSMPLLLKAIGEGPAEYRFAALDVLGAGDDELFARLTAAMPRWNAGAQAALLCWLGERHATSQSDVIARSIASPDPEIAAAAIDAATHIGDEQTLTALVGALEGPLSAKAEAALLHFNGKIDGRMEELLHRDEPQVLVAALRLTGARRLTACADRVFELLDAPQPEVADAACATLAQVARPGDAGRIAAMLDTADATRVGGLQEALHAALLPLSAEERCTRIEAFLEASPAGERYYPVLARTDTPQAVARLLERFRADGSEAAFDALLLVNTPQMIDTLYALAAEHPALTDRALGRYAELTARFRTTPVRLYQQTRRALALEASDATRSRLLTNLLDVQAYPALVLAASYLENEGTAAAAAAVVKNLVAKSSPMPGGADIRAALEKAREVYRKLAQSDADAGYAVDEITGLLGRLPETGFVALPTDPAQWQPVADSPASGRKLSAAAAAKLRRSAETALRENWTGRDGMLLAAGHALADLCAWINSWSGLSLSVNTEAFDVANLNFRVINTQMAGQFNLHMKVSMISGLVLAMPYVLWEFWRFVRPALTPREIAATHRFVFWASTFFFAGLLFGYFVLVPLSVSFFINYQASPSIVNMIDVGQYLSTVIVASVASALVFQLPLLIYFLTRMGLISSAFLKRYRRHAFVVLLVIAAIITPPDIFSLVLVIIPLYGLYELSIRLSARIERHQAAAGHNE